MWKRECPLTIVATYLRTHTYGAGTQHLNLQGSFRGRREGTTEKGYPLSPLCMFPDFVFGNDVQLDEMPLVCVELQIATRHWALDVLSTIELVLHVEGRGSRHYGLTLLISVITV